jgi:sensor histidine kinase YesM
MEKFQFPWLRFFWIPFVALVFSTLNWTISLTDSFASRYVESISSKIPFDILLSLFYTVLCSEVSLLIFTRLQKWFPIEHRLKTLIMLHVILSSLLWMEMFTITQVLLYGFDTSLKIYFFKQNLLSAVMIALFMNIVHIGMILFNRWKEAHTEAEDLKRSSLEAQNAALKQQIDPHFLFNSLNTLTALIEEEPKAAVRFVQQLSNVYRYVLQSRNHATVPLSEELAFVRAYSYLHELRFGENFRVTIDVPESAESLVLPPLVVQLCIENAVKHNVVSRQKPLYITVSAEGTLLRVTNNLQRKRNIPTSTQVGLSAIRHRYSLLTDTPATMTETAMEFIVELPLLSVDSVASVDSALLGERVLESALIEGFEHV